MPGKNWRLMHGRPLITYTIGQALASSSIDSVYVSTDSERIASIARSAGAIVLSLRPAHLATDGAPKVPVIRDLVEQIERTGTSVERVVDLDPTSPLRSLADIDACIDLLDDRSDLVITGYVAEKNPYFNMVEEKQPGSYGLVLQSSVTDRQSAPPVFAMNGSVYCWRRSSLTDTLWGGTIRLHEMPRERSIDIDHEIDWKLVELLMADRPDLMGLRQQAQDSSAWT